MSHACGLWVLEATLYQENEQPHSFCHDPDRTAWKCQRGMAAGDNPTTIRKACHNVLQHRETQLVNQRREMLQLAAGYWLSFQLAVAEVLLGTVDDFRRREMGEMLISIRISL